MTRGQRRGSSSNEAFRSQKTLLKVVIMSLTSLLLAASCSIDSKEFKVRWQPSPERVSRALAEIGS